MRIIRPILTLLTLVCACSAVLVACSAGQLFAQESVKSFNLAVTDYAGNSNLAKDFGVFEKRLSDLSGVPLKLHPLTSRSEAVELVKNKKIDFVLAGPADYVVLHKKTTSTPLVGLARPDNFSLVVVLAGLGFDSARDLVGKKIALGDRGSTDGHLAPLQSLKDLGIVPSRDLQQLHVATSLGWRALKSGEVDAIALSNDKFLELRAADRDLNPTDFKALARGQDLPSDVFLVGSHVPEEVSAKIRRALLLHSGDLMVALTAGSKNKRFKNMRFISTIRDRDYDYIREMFRTIGLPEFATFPSEG